MVVWYSVAFIGRMPFGATDGISRAESRLSLAMVPTSWLFGRGLTKLALDFEYEVECPYVHVRATASAPLQPRFDIAVCSSAV